MIRKEAYSNIIQYKNNIRAEEESNKLEHGLLSKFKPKYLEKIPLGNGKFRYIYEEVKDRVKTALNPGAMTSTEKANRTGLKLTREYVANNKKTDTEMAREETKAMQKAAKEADAKLKESAARKAAAYSNGAPTLEDMHNTTDKIRTNTINKAREDRFNSEMAKNGNKADENEYVAIEIADEEIAAIAKKDGFDIEEAYRKINAYTSEQNTDSSIEDDKIKELIDKVRKYHEEYVKTIEEAPNSVAKREILKAEKEYLDYLDIRRKEVGYRYLGREKSIARTLIDVEQDRLAKDFQSKKDNEKINISVQKGPEKMNVRTSKMEEKDQKQERERKAYNKALEYVKDIDYIDSEVTNYIDPSINTLSKKVLQESGNIVRKYVNDLSDGNDVSKDDALRDYKEFMLEKILNNKAGNDNPSEAYEKMYVSGNTIETSSKENAEILARAGILDWYLNTTFDGIYTELLHDH